MEHAVSANVGFLAALLMFLFSPLMLPGGLRRTKALIEKTMIPYFLSLSPPAALVWLLYEVSNLK